MRFRIAAIVSGGVLAVSPLIAGKTARVPALAVLPRSRAASVVQGHVLRTDSARVVISGDDRPLLWMAAVSPGPVVLVTPSGLGTGRLAWRRDTRDLATGLYVDTITVTVPNVAGSPAVVIDSLTVVPDSSARSVATAGRTQTGYPDLGRNGSFHGRRVLPASDPWNQPVDTAHVDPASQTILSTIGLQAPLHPDFGASWNGGPFGFIYTVVPESQPRVPIQFDYAQESDLGPYPFPPHVAIEPGSDAHVLVITQQSLKLYETFATQGGPPWHAGSGAIFDLVRGTKRPAGWTSADAAGLPIFPGLVRYDEVFERGVIDHALRFTVVHSRRAYIPPASHVASRSTDPRYAPMGMRVRLKASFDISRFAPPVQVILRALKKYGMIMADNGSNFFISGTADARWNDSVLGALKTVKAGDFEVVTMNGLVAE